MEDVIQYTAGFLLGKDSLPLVSYAKTPSSKKLTIIQSGFFDAGTYGTTGSLPRTPLATLPESGIPFLFGEPRLERREDGRLVLHADLVASAYFMLSRYEEIIKPDCRDKWGRFLAKDSVVFQQGYGFRPLVDEWGLYLRNLLRTIGTDRPGEKPGFSKIYLTHDVDEPFKLYNLRSLARQYALNIMRPKQYVRHPLRVLVTGKNDPYFTFQKIITYDEELRKQVSVSVESVYFIIAARGVQYCDLGLRKFRNLISLLSSSGARLGLHISHAGGAFPARIKKEMRRLKEYIPDSHGISRHHYLRWREPGHISQMQDAGITDDFTLSFADSVGFRVGTCRPYLFMNPVSKEVTGITVHPMQIMECSLDRLNYMNLGYEQALDVCTRLIDETFRYNGELNLLWHNTSFQEGHYYEKLYATLLGHISALIRPRHHPDGQVSQSGATEKVFPVQGAP